MNQLKRLCGLMAPVLLIGIFWGCGPSDARPNFLLISIDTVRADHLGCYGNQMWDQSPTPQMDKIAKEGVVFERCIAPRGQTHPSIASMLTGKYPIAHSLRENGQWLKETHSSFIQYLSFKGYRTAGFASNLYKEMNPLTHSAQANWWTRGLDDFDDGYNGDFKGETDPNRVEDQWTWDERVEKKTLDWIKAFDSHKPFFLWTHFYDPHKPYIPHPSCPDFYPEYEGPLKTPLGEKDGKQVDNVAALIDPKTRAGQPLSKEDYKKVMALYDASIYGADLRVGRIMEALKQKGLLENTWVFITSDHGEELGDHNHYYYHGASIYDAVLHVPLIVMGPLAKKGLRVKGEIQNIDMAPTILELASFGALPAGMEGESLVPALVGEKDGVTRKYAVGEWMHLIYSLSDGQVKYIHNPKGICPKKPPFMKEGYFKYDTQELYFLDQDPKEQNNVIQDHQDMAEKFAKLLKQWKNLEGHKPNEFSQTQTGINDVLKRLGYGR